MRKKKILGLLIIFALSGCSSFPLLSDLFEPSPDSLNETDLMDDFSDDDSGWEEFNYAEGSASYSSGMYQISINQPNTDIFSTYPMTYVNSEITVQASRIEGLDNNNFGIICRYKDQENFYAGQISSDGYAGIFKIERGDYQLLGHDTMVPVPAILGGESVNLIKLECLEGTLILSVNGEIADSREEDSFKTGENGLIAGNIDGKFGVFLFDNFSTIVR